jgi:Flavodoxin domain
MRAVVVYESTYGNTRHVAEAIAEGLGNSATVDVVPVSSAGDVKFSNLDLLVVGAPTHVHDGAKGSGDGTTVSDDLVLEPGVTVSGIREWLTSQRGAKGRAATFDTRIEGTTVITEPASERLADLFSDSQFDLVAGPESFMVDDDARLRPGEEERARQWGDSLARTL